MSTSREKRSEALERWAERVKVEDLHVADIASLRLIAELADRRDRVDDDLEKAISLARIERRSWSEIGAMLGVSKQAAQRKYGPNASVFRGIGWDGDLDEMRGGRPQTT